MKAGDVVELTPSDQAMLDGTLGEATQIAMELVVKVARAEGASRLLDIEAAHIDGCLYHGRAGLDFAELLASKGGRVRVPTTLNVSSLDRLHPELYRGDPEKARLAARLMDTYVEMGCEQTWTCAPYQLEARPGLGAQIAWGESNAIVFANSVLGARTNRYGDFTDICCALTGRAPFTGLHTDEGRIGTVLFHLDLDAAVLDHELAYVGLGHLIGLLAGSEVPVIVGLDDRASEDRLKALGAAAASSGSVAMFHAIGVTPEAPDLESALGGREPVAIHVVNKGGLEQARRQLGSGQGRLAAVSVGTPHMSLDELTTLAGLTHGRASLVPFYVNTSRAVLNEATEKGLLDSLEGFGVTVVTDTCTYIAPIMGPLDGDVMTNSGKWAFYAPANLGVSVRLGTLAECVESAVVGAVVTLEMW